MRPCSESFVIAKGPPFLRQSAQKGRGFPTAAMDSMEFKHARIYVCEAGRIGIKHRSSAICRKTVTGQIDHIDVDRAQRIPFFQNSGALVDQGVSRTVQNLFITDITLLKAALFG